jgi:signal transduction histidine kinase
MNDDSMTLAREDWGIFGLRWLFLVVVSVIYYILNSDVVPTDVSTNIIVTFFIGAVINIAWLVLAFYPTFRKAIPYAILIGDWVMAGLYVGLGFNQPILLLGIGSTLMIIASLRLNWLWSTVHVIGTIAVLLGGIYVVRGADQFQFFLSTVPGEIAVLLGVAVFAIGSSFVREAANHSLNEEVKYTKQRSESQLERIRERNRVMSDMAATLSATLNPTQVLEAALEAGRLGMRSSNRDYKLTSAALLFRDDGEMHVARSHGMTRKDHGHTVPGQSGILGKALLECTPVFGKDGKKDAELQFFAGFQRSRSLLAIPLHANYDNFGVLVYGSEDPDAFTQDDTDLLMAIGTQTTIALHNAVLYRNLVEEKERIVEVEEDARKKLARDLHDGPTQNVSAIAMRMSYISRLMERDPGDVPGELKKVEDLARKTTKEIRDMLFTLRPLILESQGLEAALDQLCQKTLETHGQQVAARVGQGVETVLNSHQQGVVFYIVEEAVGNARKHAEAELISINIHRQSDVVIVEISDNGVGFDADAVNANYDQRGSLGMVNMRERVALLDGTLQIASEIGKGTTITVLVPIRDPLGESTIGDGAKLTRLAPMSRPNGVPH